MECVQGVGQSLLAAHRVRWQRCRQGRWWYHNGIAGEPGLKALTQHDKGMGALVAIALWHLMGFRYRGMLLLKRRRVLVPGGSGGLGSCKKRCSQDGQGWLVCWQLG